MTLILDYNFRDLNIKKSYKHYQFSNKTNIISILTSFYTFNVSKKVIVTAI